jgi:CO/xanthine dehydrogenase FAD-binding subunit
MASVNGKVWSTASHVAVDAALGEDLDPIPNTFGSAAMKLHHQRVLTRRALDAAVQRARA